MATRAEEAELRAPNLLEPKGDREQGSRYAKEFLSSVLSS